MKALIVHLRRAQSGARGNRYPQSQQKAPLSVTLSEMIRIESRDNEWLHGVSCRRDWVPRGKCNELGSAKWPARHGDRPGTPPLTCSTACEWLLCNFPLYSTTRLITSSGGGSLQRIAEPFFFHILLTPVWECREQAVDKLSPAKSFTRLCLVLDYTIIK